MKNMIVSKKSYTLIELLIALLVIAALAAIALPDMTQAMRRYRAREAIAGLRLIEAHMRLNKHKTRYYNRKPNPGGTGVVSIKVGTMENNVPGFEANDLNGTYFRDADYRITGISTTAFTATVTGNSTGNDPESAGIIITINYLGTIKEIYN